MGPLLVASWPPYSTHLPRPKSNTIAVPKRGDGWTRRLCGDQDTPSHSQVPLAMVLSEPPNSPNSTVRCRSGSYASGTLTEGGGDCGGVSCSQPTPSNSQVSPSGTKFGLRPPNNTMRCRCKSRLIALNWRDGGPTASMRDQRVPLHSHRSASVASLPAKCGWGCAPLKI